MIVILIIVTLLHERHTRVAGRRNEKGRRCTSVVIPSCPVIVIVVIVQ